MKKVFILALLMTVLSAAVFAEKVTVTAVEGKVTVLSGSEWVAVKEGMVLDLEDSINTGLNSFVAFDNGVSVKPMRKGKLADLAAKAADKSTLVLGSSLTKESIKTLAAVNKASDGAGRASEAKEDLDWDE